MSNSSNSPDERSGTLALTDGEVLGEIDALALTDGDKLGDALGLIEGTTSKSISLKKKNKKKQKQ